MRKLAILLLALLGGVAEAQIITPPPATSGPDRGGLVTAPIEALVSIPDSGDANPGTLTETAYVLGSSVKCLDADGCEYTLGGSPTDGQYWEVKFDPTSLAPILLIGFPPYAAPFYDPSTPDVHSIRMYWDGAAWATPTFTFAYNHASYPFENPAGNVVGLMNLGLDQVGYEYWSVSLGSPQNSSMLLSGSQFRVGSSEVNLAYKDGAKMIVPSSTSHIYYPTGDGRALSEGNPTCMGTVNMLDIGGGSMGASGKLVYQVVAATNSLADQQVERSEVTFICRRVTGASRTCALGTPVTQQAMSSGTLTVTPTVSITVDYQMVFYLNGTSSLGQTVFNAAFFVHEGLGLTNGVGGITACP